MSYVSTYHRITRGANADTHKFLGKLAKAKSLPKGRPSKPPRRLGPAGVSGHARPLATPKTTGRKLPSKPSSLRSQVSRVKTKAPAGSNKSKARYLMSQLGHNPSPTRPAFKGGLVSRITRRTRHAAATLGRKVGHFARKVGF